MASFLLLALAAMVQPQPCLSLSLFFFFLTSFVWSQSLFQVAAFYSLPAVWISAMLFALTAVKVKEWEERSDFWVGLTVWVVKPRSNAFPFLVLEPPGSISV